MVANSGVLKDDGGAKKSVLLRCMRLVVPKFLLSHRISFCETIKDDYATNPCRLLRGLVALN